MLAALSGGVALMELPVDGILVTDRSLTRVLSDYVTDNTPLRPLLGLDERSEKPDPINW